MQTESADFDAVEKLDKITPTSPLIGLVGSDGYAVAGDRFQKPRKGNL
jgi:hypothetical protein